MPPKGSKKDGGKRGLGSKGPTLPKPVPAVPKVENAHSAAETSSAQAILAPEAPLFPLPGTTGGKKVKGKKKAGAEDADLSLATCASGTAMPAHLNDLWTECIQGKESDFDADVSPPNAQKSPQKAAAVPKPARSGGARGGSVRAPKAANTRHSDTFGHIQSVVRIDTKSKHVCQFCGKKSAVHRCGKCGVWLHHDTTSGGGMNVNGKAWPCAHLYHDDSRNPDVNGPCYGNHVGAGLPAKAFKVPKEVKEIDAQSAHLSPTGVHNGSKIRKTGKKKAKK